MKKFFIFLFFLPFIGFSQTTYIPDNIFENYLENNNMGDGIMGNHYVLTSNISDVSILDIDYLPVTDLTGIEDFTHLNTLSIQGCNVTSLDLSHNGFLQGLNCRNNNLTSLNVSTGPYGLTVLTCDDNQLTSLDMSSNPMLEVLTCSNNLITNLNITGCDSLREFDASYNQLTTFSFLTNPSITAPLYNPSANNSNWVYTCHANLEKIDLSHNNLTSIILQGAPLQHTAITWSGNYWVSTLDLSHNNLTEINFDELQVKYLDVSNNQLGGLFFAGACQTILYDLDASNNNLAFVVSGNGIYNMTTLNNPNLFCVSPNNPNNNWTVDSWTNIMGACAIAGCMDTNYIEYNPAANLNDGSCLTPVVLGCLDPSSIYYNPNANQNDYNLCLDLISDCHVYLGEDTVLCNNLTLSAPSGYTHYDWSTGETTQSIMVNQSGNYSVSIANNPSNEHSFHINGEQQYIEIHGTEEENPGQWYNGNGNNQSIEPQSMTVSAWVKIEGLTLGEIVVAEKWDDWEWGGTAQGWLGEGTSWRLAFTSPDLRPYVQVGVGVPDLPSTWPGGIANGAPQNCSTTNWSSNWSGYGATCFAPTSVSLNTWYYLSFTWDPFGNALSLYIDGVQVNQTTFTTSGCSPLIFPSLCNITIGNKPSSQNPTQPLLSNVYIDEVGVWDTSLVPYQINYYMNCPPIGTHPQLVGFWDFENTLHTDSNNIYMSIFQLAR